MISKHRNPSLLAFSFSLVLAGMLSPSRLLAQDIVVTSDDPSSAPQGSVGLNIVITGKGFKRDAKAQFFVTGTTNPGGITVNSTTFLNGTQIVANITVSSNATIAQFDTMVTSGGRTGKGIELFSVTKKGTSTKCTLAPLPSAFTQLGTLNAGQYTGGGFGYGVRAGKITLGGQDVRLAAVSVGITKRIEVFFLDPVTGQVLDGTVIGNTGNVQPHLTLLMDPTATQGPRAIAFGDVNNDGTPDIAAGVGVSNTVDVFLGALNNGVLTYSAAIPVLRPDNQNYYGEAVALGDLDGIAGDELVVGAPGTGSGSNMQNGKVYVYKYSAASNPPFGLYKTLASPLPNDPKGLQSDLFGSGLAIGDVAGGPAPDLAVEAANSTKNQKVPGRVFVFPGFDLSSQAAVALSTGGAAYVYTGRTAIANIDGGYDDVVGIGTNTAPVFSGLVASGQSPTFTLSGIIPDLGNSFGNDLTAQDLNADAFAEILIGAPNSSICPTQPSIGTAYVYSPDPTAPTQPPFTYLLQPPSLDSGYGGYGFATAAVPESNLFLVGENGRDINGVSLGQVYVYRMN